MSIIGVGLGVLGASIILSVLGTNGIEMLEQPVEFAGMKISKIYPANTIIGNLIYPVELVVASVVGALWPAWRASNLDPVAALREL